MIEPADAIENRVIALVAEEISISRERLELSTELGRHCGVDGEDGAAFMEKFQATFGINMRSFELSRHFGPEAPFSLIWYLFMLAFDRGRLKLEPIAISDLVRAARGKRWPEERRPAVFWM